MNNHYIVWMYARSKHAETLQEVERYRLIKQTKGRPKANRQQASFGLKSLPQRLQMLVSCVRSAPQGQRSVCLT